MLVGLNRVLAKQPRGVLIAIALVMIGSLGVLDHLTGYEISFSIFYLIPIFLVSWYTPRPVGLSIAALAACVWMAVDLSAGHLYSSRFIPPWNALVRFGFFVIIVFLLTHLKTVLERETELARIDPLTGVLNSRAFRELLRRDLELANRHQTPSSLLYLDVDDFKRVNDTLGHEAGDEVLRSIARGLVETVRHSDLVGRLGGDEFVVFLPLADYSSAETVIQKLQAGLSQVRLPDGRPVAVSVGAISFTGMPASIDEAIAVADELMYQVKNGGKNDVCHLHWPIRDLPGNAGETTAVSLFPGEKSSG